ncbi:ubiquitin-protein ligase RMD5 KNAG_0A04010 [Huiozyma naganishii CBS 8797]|uniref:GID complex catalytic subunit 2 n=1 Tax=Huiozyma naganishii (strain ATCC MYA-139 / BCRC 22969 / CBS 8797 / KCTC 17520 / NBRC 10181 / NCYC 3082 / Yp74L-3) TaxID=1071383 RepID=J7QZX5_HUIN7|nr:hypothetical protein KNAG_0A04010 [Kazachstania naganishii CBS 8797]CCK68080.1 hypothetical protein KNAG_0A04010 [Kazachstania naganishii CBS 8797]
MAKLLGKLEAEFEKLTGGHEAGGSGLRQTLSDTQDLKQQLRKLKAHLNKNIQEREGSPQDNKLMKKRAVIQDKVNKCYKVWDHAVKRQGKAVGLRYACFRKDALAQLKGAPLEEIYQHKIAPANRAFVDRAIGFHISRYNVGDLPLDEGANIVQYLETAYRVDRAASERLAPMGRMIHDLRRHEFDSCAAWASDHGDSVTPRLQFELFILKALQMVKVSGTTHTVKYLIDNVPQNLITYSEDSTYKDVSAALLAKMVLGHELPDIDAIIQERLQSCIRIFTHEFCAQNSLPFDSPLFLTVLSGIISLQYFIKYNQIRAASHVGWTTRDELPFDVELPDFLSHFHPIFICPVLKEETTSENPPYSLSCHHIISKKALDRLSKNGNLSFKCPYCPVHTTMIKTKRVNFVIL